MGRLPDFFILGAPKCGTTSLASWLARNDRIFFSPEKEPNYYNTDVRTVGRLEEHEYRKLFWGAQKHHLRVGEATTGYLRSAVAVPAILSDVPDALFIVCCRNPVDMALSLHAERLKEGLETESNFEVAWRLQAERAQGRMVPLGCVNGDALDYGSICRVGEQVERVVSLVGLERVLLLLLDDLKSDPAREYRKVLKFLGVPDDGETSFPVENAAIHLPRLAARGLRLGTVIKKSLGFRKRTGIITVARSWLGRPKPRFVISRAIKMELGSYFDSDVKRLGAVMRRDLSYWLQGSA